jgi:hypothetical protein
MSGVSKALNSFPDARTNVYLPGVAPAVGSALANIDPRDSLSLIENSPTGSMAQLQIENQPASEWMVPLVVGSFQHVIVAGTGKALGSYARNRKDVTAFNDGVGVGEDWFERLHIFPKDYELGNVVSNLVFNIDLYSSFRRDSITLSVIDNQIEFQGVTITGAPSLPETQQPQTSIGLSLNISQIGAPAIDGDIVFDYNVRDITITVSGTRVTILQYPPQRDIRETLSWKTDVMKSADGTEMRSSIRRFPRQTVEYEIVPRRPRDVSSLRALIMEWQPRVFGVPLWWWARKLTVDASSGALSVVVSNLENMDIRVGGLIMVAKTNPNDVDEVVSNVRAIDHLGSPTNTITFTSALTEDFEVLNGAFIAPVIPCVVDRTVDLTRAPDGFVEYKMRFTSTVNETNLANTSPFTSYLGKVVMDMCNITGRAYTQKLTHKNTRVDYDIGLIQAFSTQLVGVSSHPLKMQNDTNLEEWERRGLLYALRGRQISFFLPTNQPDMQLITDALSGATTIDIENIGYTKFIQNRAPIQDIQITLNDGTVNYHRVTGSVEISPGERLTISPGLAQDTSVADTKEICFLLQQRMASDNARITHSWVNTDGDFVDSIIELQTVGVPNG